MYVNAVASDAIPKDVAAAEAKAVRRAEGEQKVLAASLKADLACVARMPPGDETALQVLAVAGDDWEVNALSECLRDVGVRFMTRQPTEPNLKARIEHWMAAGLVQQEDAKPGHAKRVALTPGLASLLTRQVLERDPGLARRVEQALGGGWQPPGWRDASGPGDAGWRGQRVSALLAPQQAQAFTLRASDIRAYPSLGLERHVSSDMLRRADEIVAQLLLSFSHVRSGIRERALDAPLETLVGRDFSAEALADRDRLDGLEATARLLEGDLAGARARLWRPEGFARQQGKTGKRGKTDQQRNTGKAGRGGQSQCPHPRLDAALQILTGDAPGGFAAYEAALPRKRPKDFAAFLHASLLALRGGHVNLEQARHLAAMKSPRTPTEEALAVLRGHLDQILGRGGGPPRVAEEPFAVLAFAIGEVAAQEPAMAGHIVERELARWIEQAEGLGYHWYVDEGQALLNARLGHGGAAGAGSSSPVLSSTLLSVIERRAPWENALEVLEALVDKASPSKAADTVPERVAWEVDAGPFGVEISARHQKASATGWSKGRRLALSRLKSGTVDAMLTATDRKVIAHLREDRVYNGYGTSKEYSISPAAIRHLIGAPNAVSPDGAPLTVKGEAARFLVKRSANGLTVTPRPYGLLGGFGDGDGGVLLVEQQGTTITVTHATADLARALDALGGSFQVPAEGETRLLETLGKLAPVLPTEGDVGVHLTGNAADAQPGDPTPVLRLVPRRGGLTVNLVVTPFGPDVPQVAPTPGDGEVTLMHQGADGAVAQVRRDLDAEYREAHELCELLNLGPPTPQGWVLDSMNLALDLVAGLQTIEGMRVEWPEGRALKVLPAVEGADFQASGSGADEWFRVGGDIELSDGATLSVFEMVQRLRSSEGRFVSLGNDQYARLTETLERQLRTLDAFSAGAADSDDELRVHPLVALALGDQLDGDDAYRAVVRRCQAADRRKPRLPAGFQAELRPYQMDGFRWLSRLATLGAGALLCDDMGLGKTVQTLALLASRAAEKGKGHDNGGPALIVAPASVCDNWLREAARFAPKLRTHWYQGTGRVLGSPTRGDVVVCTYDIVHLDRDALAAIHWDTVVLDEGQNIKNATSRRARAAFALPAHFRLVTTGTPVENHLGELWSLFRFAMPGLLGAQQQFVARFRSAIEGRKDAAALQSLRRLVRPFILRRTKDAVLKELPPRTDVVRRITLSEPERGLYEAVRLRGLEALSAADTGPPGQQRLKVLTELMRLRQAACHPRLVEPRSEVESTKLATTVELLRELREEGHRALVFSQFVEHLSLLREALDDEGITYQYLDGSTPTKQRGTLVDRFQAGEGDAFLISLKAGGTGLNLTAADYVLHLDPWWNPAAEDQASDRAHRMGQDRPVTVIRLVAADTVEERILELHAIKRELADAIVSGTSAATAIDHDALVALLRDG